MHNTCWPDTCSRGMAQHIHGAHTTQRGYTWAHKGREAGGGSGRGWGFERRTHLYERMVVHSSLHTRNSTQHCLTEGWEGGKGSKPRWKHSSKETESSAVVNTHTPARKHATHQVRDSPEGGEGCGCGLWGHGTSAVLGRSHYRHHRATGDGMEWDGIGWGVCVRDRERPDAGERG